MGVLGTTYTFTATDTITSAKMNNIIDQTTITSDAIIGTTLDVASGKLKIRSAGITSNEMGSASVTQTALASNVATTGPAFRAVIAADQAFPAGSADYKVTLVKDFDTNNNFLNSRFTATIAGYYLFSGSTGVNVASGTNALTSHSVIYKNGLRFAVGSFTAYNAGSSCISSVSSIFYMAPNDYVELFAYHNSNNNGSIISNNSTSTYLCGCLIRSA